MHNGCLINNVYKSKRIYQNIKYCAGSRSRETNKASLALMEPKTGSGCFLLSENNVFLSRNRIRIFHISQI